MVGYDAENKKQLSKSALGAAGIFSGMLTRFLAQPLDVIKIRFQLQHEPLRPDSHNYYWNMKQASSRIIREESFRAMWKGHVPAQLLSAVYGLAQFGTFEFLTKLAHLNLKNENNGAGRHFWTNFICGSLSGAMGTIVSMPLDTIRTRLVGQGEPKIYKGLTHAFISMFKNEGVGSLYRGLSASLIQIMPQTGVQFASFRLLTNLYWKLSTEDKKSKLPLAGNLLCGSLSGLFAKIAIYPLDLSKKRLQVQGFDQARSHFGRVTHYKGLIDCIVKTGKEEGLSGIYKGLKPSMIKAMITTALTFTFYEEICHIFIKFGLT